MTSQNQTDLTPEARKALEMIERSMLKAQSKGLKITRKAFFRRTNHTSWQITHCCPLGAVILEYAPMRTNPNEALAVAQGILAVDTSFTNGFTMCIDRKTYFQPPYFSRLPFHQGWLVAEKIREAFSL